MPTTIRLTKKEEKDLYSKCIEINKKLVSKSKMPVRESELAHYIMDNCVEMVKVNKDGELYIEL